MANQALDSIVDSLSAGRMGVDDFMRVVEEHVNDLHPDTSDLAGACREPEIGMGSKAALGT